MSAAAGIEEPVAPAERREDGCGECPVKSLTALVRDVDVALRGAVPDEFWQHRRAARREALLALRSLLDAAIDRVDKEPAARPSRRPTKIAIG